MGGGDDRQMQAAEGEKKSYSVGERIGMIILRGSAQPKKSESLNQIFSQSLTQYIKKKSTFYMLVGHLMSAQSTK